jgi:Flp pilus assembly protein TadD
LAEFRRAVHLDPRFGPAHQGIAIVLRRQNHLPEALVEFKETVRLMPQNPVALCDLGLAQKESGDLANAITNLRRATELQPDYERARYALGIALKQRGESGKAASEMQSVRQSRQSRAQLSQIKLLLTDAQAHPANAIKDYLDAVELNPDNPDLRILLANALVASGQNDRAAQVYDELIKRAPKFAEAYNNRGLLSLEMGKLPAAKTDFEEALKLKPAYGPAHYNLGLALEKMGDNTRAQAEFKAARALCSESGKQTCPQ